MHFISDNSIQTKPIRTMKSKPNWAVILPLIVGLFEAVIGLLALLEVITWEEAVQDSVMIIFGLIIALIGAFLGVETKKLLAKNADLMAENEGLKEKLATGSNP